MADIYPFNFEVSLDIKWAAVKIHYEAAYHIKFKDRLTDGQIQEYWMQMNKLEDNRKEHVENQGKRKPRTYTGF